MRINFKNGYYIESHNNGWTLKYDTGRIKKSKDGKEHIPIISRIAHTKTLKGAVNILADYKIRKIDSDKLLVIMNKIDRIKEEIKEVLTSYDIKFNIKEPKK